MKRATCRWLSFSRRTAPNAGTRSLVDVVGVDGGGGRLERSGFLGQPGGEVIGDGLAVVEPDPGTLAVEDAGQRGGCGLAGGVAAASHGGALAGEAGHVDGESPGAVSGVGRQLRATRTELLARVAAGAASVDAAAVGVGARHVRPPQGAHTLVGDRTSYRRRPHRDHSRCSRCSAAQRLTNSQLRTAGSAEPRTAALEANNEAYSGA